MFALVRFDCRDQAAEHVRRFHAPRLRAGRGALGARERTRKDALLVGARVEFLRPGASASR